MIPIAEISDLETRLGRDVTGPDRDRAQSNLDDATDLVLWETGEFAEDDEVPRIVRAIVIRAALRSFQNPDGLSSESAGDYSYQRNGVAAEGSLYLTERERQTIRRAAGRTGLWTQPITTDEEFPRLDVAV